MRLSHAMAVLILFVGCNKKPTAQDEDSKAIEEGTQLTTQNVVESSIDSIGTVYAKIGDEFESLGSGFFISEDGKFVTNWHVVDEHETFQVKLDNGGSYDVERILYANPKRDISILKVQGKQFSPLEMDDLSSLKSGHPVVVIGSPKGLESSVSDGIISSIRDYSELEAPADYLNDTKCIQVTAPISSGSSGSAIISKVTKKVIAVASFRRTDGESLNFGISADHIKELLKDKTLPPKSITEEKKELVETKPEPEPEPEPKETKGIIPVSGVHSINQIINLTWFNLDGKIHIEKCGVDPDYFKGRIVIPETIKGLPVTSIGDSVFKDYRLVKIELPETLTHIGKEAFYGHNCSNIIIPKSVKSIGANAFFCVPFERRAIPISDWPNREIYFMGDRPETEGLILCSANILVEKYINSTYKPPKAGFLETKPYTWGRTTVIRRKHAKGFEVSFEGWPIKVIP